MSMKRKSGRTLSILWLLLIVVAIMLGNLPGFTRNTSILDGTSTPYRVSITTSNFRISQLSASADDVSNPQRVLFHLQNGTALWYGISVTSTPAGIVPIAATPSDIVSSTFSSSFALLPPAQVLPSDQWNGVYHFQMLQLDISFSGPGQQFQLTLSPTEPHAVTLDVITLLLHLLGLHSEGTQIGLLENGQLANIFTMTSRMKDFETLVQDYSQILTSGADATQTAQTLASAYACALDISNLLSDNSEQATLADLLWHIQGKAVSRDSILQTITSFSQSQFGLAVEGFIKGQAATFAPTLTSGDSPTVQLQTISNIIISPTSASSPTRIATSTPTKRPTATTPTSPLTPTRTPVITSTPTK